MLVALALFFDSSTFQLEDFSHSWASWDSWDAIISLIFEVILMEESKFDGFRGGKEFGGGEWGFALCALKTELPSLFLRRWPSIDSIMIEEQVGH